MQTQKVLKKVLGVAALGTFAALPILSSTQNVQADPPSHAPAWGYRDKNKHDDYRNDYWKDRDRDRKDHDWNNRDRRDRDRHDRDRRDRDRDRRDRNDYWKNRNRNRSYYQTYQGTVTGVHGNDRFDLRANGTTYNVYLSTRTPRRLDRGDIVRVYGVRSGNNDIRNASVAIIRNR